MSAPSTGIRSSNHPDHVPESLVRDLTWAEGLKAVTYTEPYQDTEVLLGGDYPPLMWIPDAVPGMQGVGCWVVTSYADIARVYQDSELFSTKGAAGFQLMVGETWPNIPLGIDPPDHMMYRAMLNPWFSPKAINALEKNIRSSANALIDGFIEARKADFAWDFARVFPVRVFLDLMGLPFAMFDQFLEWEFAILHGGDFEVAKSSVRDVIAYLRGFIAEQQTTPNGGLVSRIVNAEIDGRPINADEMIGTVFFLWLGGLDTVASSLSLMFRRLSLDTAMQQTLRDNPAMLPEAIEEMLRVHPLVNSLRLVKKDFEWHGQMLKQGDWIKCLVTVGNFDPAEFENPRTVQLDRQPNRHFTLAGGPHRCLGSHLARRELKIALEEWFRRVPLFRLSEKDTREVYPGLQSVRHLHIEW